MDMVLVISNRHGLIPFPTEFDFPQEGFKLVQQQRRVKGSFGSLSFLFSLYVCVCVGGGSMHEYLYEHVRPEEDVRYPALLFSTFLL